MRRMPASTTSETTGCFYVFRMFGCAETHGQRLDARVRVSRRVAAGQKQQPPAVHDLELRFVRFLLVFRHRIIHRQVLSEHRPNASSAQ
jgi:hypothetical protein